MEDDAANAVASPIRSMRELPTSSVLSPKTRPPAPSTTPASQPKAPRAVVGRSKPAAADDAAAVVNVEASNLDYVAIAAMGVMLAAVAVWCSKDAMAAVDTELGKLVRTKGMLSKGKQNKFSFFPFVSIIVSMSVYGHHGRGNYEKYYSSDKRAFFLSFLLRTLYSQSPRLTTDRIAIWGWAMRFPLCCFRRSSSRAPLRVGEVRLDHYEGGQGGDRLGRQGVHRGWHPSAQRRGCRQGLDSNHHLVPFFNLRRRWHPYLSPSARFHLTFASGAATCTRVSMNSMS